MTWLIDYLKGRGVLVPVKRMPVSEIIHMADAIEEELHPAQEVPDMPAPDTRSLTERHADTMTNYVAELERQETELSEILHAGEQAWQAERAKLESDIAEIQHTRRAYGLALNDLRPPKSVAAALATPPPSAPVVNLFGQEREPVEPLLP